jgi:hypothetical protein
VALAPAVRVIIYPVIARRQPYHELGDDSFPRLDPQARAKRLVHQLGLLGFAVQVPAQRTAASLQSAFVLAQDP